MYLLDLAGYEHITPTQEPDYVVPTIIVCSILLVVVVTVLAISLKKKKK